MKKVVIDTDPGTDDAIALMMALGSPELDILALTTVGGNAPLAQTTRNALRILEYMDRPDIEVFRGSAQPLRGRFHYAHYFHGPSGLTVRLPFPATRTEPRRAAEFITEQSRVSRGEFSAIALGPLTNLARAIQKDRRLIDRIDEIVVMGGAVEVPGNVTAHAEFNIYNDPAAAEIVLSSGIPIKLIGLDVCDRVFAERGDAWLCQGSYAESLGQRILDGWFATHSDQDRYSLCDPLAVVAALRPELFSFRRGTVRVEVRDPDRFGKTEAVYGVGNVQIAIGVQEREAKQAIRSMLSGESL